MDDHGQNTRRISSDELLTPQLDPTSPSPSQTSDEVFFSDNPLEYVTALQKTLPTSVIASEETFDHFNKLYKLMEEMLDLRQQNACLLNRIRDMERLKYLESLHHQLRIQELSDDLVLAQTETKKDYKNKPWSRSRLRQSITKRPGGHDDCDKISSGKSSNVSKWTRVKAAFRWEKAAPSVTGAKSQDSGISGMTPVNFEIARYLRVPSSDEAGTSPADSGAADGSTPASLSSASSTDDLHRTEHRRSSNKTRRSVQRKYIHSRLKEYQDQNDDQTEEERRDASDRETSTNSRSNSRKWSKRRKRSSKGHIPDDVVLRYQKALADDENSGKKSRKRISKWVRVKKAFLHPVADENRNKREALLEGSALCNTSDDRNTIHEEIQDNYKQLQDKLSLEFKAKLLEWEKLKASNAVPSTSVDEPRDPAFAKKMEEWEKIKTQPLKPQIVSEQNLPPEFRKKLDEWEKIKKSHAKDDLLPKSRKKIGEWPRWKSISGHQTHNQPLSDDFRKKLEEWKKIKETAKEASQSPPSNRRHSLPKSDEWFEQEVDKMTRENERLKAKRQKFLQREERLGILRRTVLGSEGKKEVLIRTPSGFQRFEGISRKFKQKLCEWEASQGIGPEASTFALLSSSLTPNITVNLCDTPQDQQSRLLRSKSAESIAVSHLDEVFQALSHHPSSLSLNDIDGLERQCLALSTNPSYQNIIRSLGDMSDEPEAVIVEVEDLVEETAGPLEEYLQEKHFPIYQREAVLNTCDVSVTSHTSESERIVVPHVAESITIILEECNYLMDEMLDLTSARKTNEGEILFNPQENAWPNSANRMYHRCRVIGAAFKEINSDSGGMDLKEENRHQTNLHALLINLTNLREVHSKNIVCLLKCDELKHSGEFLDHVESAKNLFALLYQTIEKLKTSTTTIDTTKTESIFEKLKELKQILSYIYANCDITDLRAKHKDAAMHESQTGEEYKIPQINIEEDSVQLDQALVEKFVISTNANYMNSNVDLPILQEPASVFVNTTRKVFTPLEGCVSVHEKSPTPPKLPKEISPGIREMLDKYNQMITKQDTTSGRSRSPIAFRTPVSERLVKARRERYLERAMVKSASSAGLNTSKTEPNKSILRSTSVSLIQPITTPKNYERYNKLQKAKEEFLRVTVTELSEAPTRPNSLVQENRFSQISTATESSDDSPVILAKSASDGMMASDDAKNPSDSGVHQYGYLSLPRVPAKEKSGILSNIAAKFRKAKMKRDRKMNTISVLCRQSLLVDLNSGSRESVGESLRHENLSVPTQMSSEDVSASSSRSGSWLRGTKIFKAL